MNKKRQRIIHATLTNLIHHIYYLVDDEGILKTNETEIEAKFIKMLKSNTKRFDNANIQLKIFDKSAPHYKLVIIIDNFCLIDEFNFNNNSEISFFRTQIIF